MITFTTAILLARKRTPSPSPGNAIVLASLLVPALVIAAIALGSLLT